MNRIMGRARVLLILILVLALGVSFFLGEYLIHGDSWILFPGSPHIYNAGNIGCGIITDRDGILMLDLTGGRTYAQNAALRSSTIHWLGDRQGNISAPALAHYADQIAGFDLLNGVYAYGGTGGTVTTTLSARVQIAALEAMGDHTGTVAVYNYKTGELICAVTTPNYDPDDVPDISGDNAEGFEGIYLNRFTQSTYTPGSIFKIVTLAAALEAIPDIQQQTFTCTGTRSYGVDKVTCEKTHGAMTLKEAFAKSCNCTFAQIADQLGGEVLQRYAQQFHIIDSVNFDGITTAAGSLDVQGRADVLVAWSAIGQHKDLINPCRFMTFLGAIANDGVEVQPHLVSQIRSGITNSYRAESYSAGRIMSTQTAKTLQAYLRNNVENYYGDDDFPGLAVCAKSGTAEVGGSKKPNAMFTGFVTDTDLPLAFIVTVEDGGYGRTVCTPIISSILESCRQYLAFG
ncbi:MAG: penicillin-binding protein [Oscillospiraceae bacterium]|nr:penicillin-binding protein [Oscillospiraceae bacterium]